ncbi:MAG: nucleotidyltransferase family protein [Nocardioides sp.]|nr:nucleotidyltransferase family protein [Nocardioides sp.]
MTAPLNDVVAEGRRLVESAAPDLRIRLLGGVGVALHDHRPVPAALERGYGDLDVVVPPKSARQTTAAMTAAGYEPNERFNALHGAQRMLFYDTDHKRQVDVFVGVFAMCHRLDLSARLDQHPYSLDAADLLLTKLQIHQINRKDLVDAVRLILTHDNVDITGGGEGTTHAMSLDRLRSVTSTDWGWFTTVTDNLQLVRAAASELLEPEDAGLVESRVDQIDTGLRAAPKSMRWKARSVIGRKTPWYELPEEVGGA